MSNDNLGLLGRNYNDFWRNIIQFAVKEYFYFDVDVVTYKAIARMGLNIEEESKWYLEARKIYTPKRDPNIHDANLMVVFFKKVSGNGRLVSNYVELFLKTYRIFCKYYLDSLRSDTPLDYADYTTPMPEYESS